MPSATAGGDREVGAPARSGWRRAGTGCRAGHREPDRWSLIAGSFGAPAAAEDVAAARSPRRGGGGWRRPRPRSSRSGATRPSPAPLSPWKYSLKTRLSFHAGSCCSLSTPPKQGRRPSAPTRKMEIRRWRRSWAISPRVSFWPDPVGYSIVKRVPEEAVVALQGADDEVVERKPQRARASWSCRRTWRWSTRPARSRWWPGCPRRSARRGGPGGRRRWPAARRARGTPPRRRAWRRSAARRSTPTTPSSSRRLPGSPCSSPASGQLLLVRRVPPAEQAGELLGHRPGFARLASSSTTAAASMGMMPDHRTHLDRD